jgi:two-component system CheB/CheR fusion protein
MIEQKQSVLALHVEDDERLGESIGMLLRSYGHQVVTAKDGRSALECVNRHQIIPDVLIVDFMLPGEMDGADVAQAVCGLLRRAIPTIIVSGALSTVSLPWLPGAPLLCLWKPVEPEILVKAMESFAEFGRFAHAYHTRDCVAAAAHELASDEPPA